MRLIAEALRLCCRLSPWTGLLVREQSAHQLFSKGENLKDRVDACRKPFQGGKDATGPKRAQASGTVGGEAVPGRGMQSLALASAKLGSRSTLSCLWL